MKSKFYVLCLIAVSFFASAQFKHNRDTISIIDNKDLIKPKLFADLGESICTPDALALDKDGNLYLSVPNFNKHDIYGSKICKFNSAGKPETWIDDLPLDTATKKVYPMGMAFGSDGNLYIADNQSPSGKPNKSRLLRVTIKKDKPVKTEVVVVGFNIANGVRAFKDRIYISDSYCYVKGKQDQSGVYSFSVNEFNKGVIHIIPESKDPHLLCTFTSKVFGNRHEQGGADGITLDSDGNLYAGNFSDGVISKVELNKDRTFKSQKVIIDSDKLRCCDGIYYYKKTNSIYIANFSNNSIHVLDLNKKELRILWENDNATGEDGLIDQPCDPIIYKGKLLIVNFDSFKTEKNKDVDDFHSISAIDL